MKYFTIWVICISIISCIGNNKTQNILEYEDRIVAYTTRQRGVSVNEIRFSDINFNELPIEIKGLAYKDGEYGVYSDIGIFLLTNINNNNVNVRNYPSLESDIVYKLNNNDIIQIIGSSGEKVNIDNFYGDWVNILHQKNDNEYIVGWVFSKYVNANDREYVPISFIGFETSRFGYTLMRVTHTLHESESFNLPNWNDWNNYYVIVWSQFDNFFHYNNRPGVYSLNKETMELRHITYLGSFGSTAHRWTVFTDDFQYLIQDSGTGPYPRGITVWRSQDLKKIFSGLYYEDANIYDNFIEVVYRMNDWSFERGFTDEEIMEYGRRYKEENPAPQEMIERLNPTLDIELLVRCSINLDTGERKILGGQYIFTN
jgi:hypothetical protein